METAAEREALVDATVDSVAREFNYRPPKYTIIIYDSSEEDLFADSDISFDEFDEPVTPDGPPCNSPETGMTYMTPASESLVVSHNPL
jgi:hypothetical protein